MGKGERINVGKNMGRRGGIEMSKPTFLRNAWEANANTQSSVATAHAQAQAHA